jgi:hypothetical protein
VQAVFPGYFNFLLGYIVHQAQISFKASQKGTRPPWFNF